LPFGVGGIVWATPVSPTDEVRPPGPFFIIPIEEVQLDSLPPSDKGGERNRRCPGTKYLSTRDLRMKIRC